MSMVPIIASADDIPAALEYAQNHPAARLWVAKMAAVHDASDTIPAEWGEAITAAGRRPKLGTGARFRALKGKLAARGVNDPGALAAYIGRKKFGSKKMASLSAKGRTASAAVTADAGTGTDERTAQLGMPSAGWLRRVRSEINAAGLDPDVIEAQLGGGFATAYDGTDAVAYAEQLLDQVITDLADEFPELTEAAQEIAAETDPNTDDDTGDDQGADDDSEEDGEPQPAEPAPAGQIDPSAPAPAPAAAAPVAASAAPGQVFYVGQPAPAAPFDQNALVAALVAGLTPVIAAGRTPVPDDEEDPTDPTGAGMDPDLLAEEAPNGIDPDGDGDVDIPGSPLDTDDDAAALQAPDAAPPADAADATAPAPVPNLDDAKAKLRARFGAHAKPKPKAAPPVAASAMTASAMRARLAAVRATKTTA